MVKEVFVSGSIAYDHLMKFEGFFKDNLLISDLENLSVSFQTKSEEKFFGGCAPNIAYNLKLLGIVPVIFGIGGNDFGEYDKWLKKNKISTSGIEIESGEPTASAYILSDKKENQIAIFSRGAIGAQKFFKPKFGVKRIDAAIISPDLPERMCATAEFFWKQKKPFIFDPGQATVSLKSEVLVKILSHAKGLITNQYEADLLAKKVGKNFKALIQKLDFNVVTLGENGCELTEKGKKLNVGAVKNSKVVDATGCGDAFRGGFLAGYVNKMPLEKCCKIGNTAASFALETKGTQNHKYNLREFNLRLQKSFGFKISF